MTYAEYFAFEAKAAERHEFLDGQIFAMGGGTIEHAGLIAGVSIALGTALRDRPCRIFSAELRIRIRATGLTSTPMSPWSAANRRSTPKIPTPS